MLCRRNWSIIAYSPFYLSFSEWLNFPVYLTKFFLHFWHVIKRLTKLKVFLHYLTIISFKITSRRQSLVVGIISLEGIYCKFLCPWACLFTASLHREDLASSERSLCRVMRFIPRCRRLSLQLVRLSWIVSIHLAIVIYVRKWNNVLRNPAGVLSMGSWGLQSGLCGCQVGLRDISDRLIVDRQASLLPIHLPRRNRPLLAPILGRSYSIYVW